MIKRADQPAKRHTVGRHAFNLAHVLIDIGVGLVALAVLAVGALAVRLSQGPIVLDALVRPMLVSVNQKGPTQISIAHTELAWGGWKKSNAPVRFQVQQLEVFQTVGGVKTDLARLPDAAVSLALPPLLLGELRPRTITIDGVSLHVTRAKDGTIAVDLGSLLTQTPNGPAIDLVALGLLGGGRGALDQLREVKVQQANIDITDQSLAQDWHVAGAGLDFTRKSGDWQGTTSLPLQLGAVAVRLDATAAIKSSGAMSLQLATNIAMPSDLANAMPQLAGLAALQVPLNLSLSADLTPQLVPTAWNLDAKLGQGQIAMGDGTLPLAGGDIAITGTNQAAQITNLAIDLPAKGGVSHLTGSGQIARGQTGVTGGITLAIDKVGFADLPQLWPDGVAIHARDWVVNNITAGSARKLHVEATFTAQPDFSNLAVAGVTGGLEAQDLRLTWLKDVPPVTGVRATLYLFDRQNMMVAIHSGQQGPINVTGGSFAITAMLSPHPQGSLAINATGKLPDLLTLLAVPRLHLLDRHPVNFVDPQGAFVAQFGLSLPLNKIVPMAEIGLAGQMHVDSVHLGKVAAGHDLDGATIDLTVDNNGLAATGQGNYAQMPATIAYNLDFRAPPPDQILQHVVAKGVGTPAQIAAAGYDPLGLLDQGQVGLAIDYTQTRSGKATLAVNADLTQASLTSHLGWHKDIGSPGSATGVLSFQNAALVDVPNFTASAPQMALGGKMTIAQGQIAAISVSHLQLGASDIAGTVTFPAQPGGAYAIRLLGNNVDLSGQFKHSTQDDSDHGPHYILDAIFAHAKMANNQTMDQLVAHAESNQGVVRAAALSFGAQKQVTLDIAPTAGGRSLHIHTNDAGALALATDTLTDVRDGTLNLDGIYDDSKPHHPLSGSATVTNFRISNAPAVTKLLQALTGYGLIALAQGRGLAITDLQTSFTDQQNVLTLKNARAHSASIGFTASGTIDLGTSQMNLHGTIVPAYILNNALSHLPLVGTLFSAEKGGGVVAPTFSVTGSHDNPKVSVNPFAVIAPGFLRNMFNNGK